MIQREKRIKIWYVIKRAARKLNIVDIPKETEISYWENMKVPNENVRYLIIDCFCLDTDFFYHAFEETDLKEVGDNNRIKEMFEHYFAKNGDNMDSTGETLLLIDVKTLKSYTINKQIKYVKKLI